MHKLKLLLILISISLTAYAANDSIPENKIIDLYTAKEAKRLEDWFVSTIQNRAKAKWQAPEQPYCSLTAFQLRLSPDGEIKDIVTVYNTGSAPLEESARNALLAASPTPVAPPVIFKDHSVILFTFEHRVNNQDISDADKNFKSNPAFKQASKKYYEDLAAKNNPSVLFDLGEFYISGEDPYTKNYTKAFGYFKRASDLGFVPAKNAVAALYSIGLGCTKDQAQALKLFKEAADAGFIPAQINLARMIVHGEGTEKNPREAALLYTKASKKGSNLAAKELEVLEGMVKDNQF